MTEEGREKEKHVNTPPPEKEMKKKKVTVNGFDVNQSPPPPVI